MINKLGNVYRSTFTVGMLILCFFLSCNRKSSLNNHSLVYLNNPQLKTILPSWKGTPQMNGRFVNHEFPFNPKPGDVFKWLTSKNPQRHEKKHEAFRLKTQTDSSFLSHSNDCIVWLGHATFFIRINGVEILIDPVFYNVPFVTRYSEHAFSPALFKQLDYLLISHDHQDHCQKKSIQQIVKYNPDAKVLAGLQMEKLLRPWMGKNPKIEEAGWYQQFTTHQEITISFLPSRHWSKRTLHDTNTRLWGSFAISSISKTIYFSGDTGNGAHFKDAKAILPPIDVAIMGVGAYKPEWFMNPNHISPSDAVTASKDLGAKYFIPMHYGTFDLSDEPAGEPVRILQQQKAEVKLTAELKLLNLGECFTGF